MPFLAGTGSTTETFVADLPPKASAAVETAIPACISHAAAVCLSASGVTVPALVERRAVLTDLTGLPRHSTNAIGGDTGDQAPHMRRQTQRVWRRRQPPGEPAG